MASFRLRTLRPETIPRAKSRANFKVLPLNFEALSKLLNPNPNPSAQQPTRNEHSTPKYLSSSGILSFKSHSRHQHIESRPWQPNSLPLRCAPSHESPPLSSQLEAFAPQVDSWTPPRLQRYQSGNQLALFEAGMLSLSFTSNALIKIRPLHTPLWSPC